MQDHERRQRRWLIAAVLCAVALAPASWLLVPDDLTSAGRWLAIAFATTGLFCLYAALTLVPSAFEVEWEQVPPSDGLRGADPAGWTEGRSEFDLGEGRQRNDSSLEGAWDGMEAPLEHGEALRAEADERQAARAAERWAAQEAADPELIEAGVQRLGDLVATGHFARTPDPGGVLRRMKTDEPKTP